MHIIFLLFVCSSFSLFCVKRLRAEILGARDSATTAGVPVFRRKMTVRERDLPLAYLLVFLMKRSSTMMRAPQSFLQHQVTQAQLSKGGKQDMQLSRSDITTATPSYTFTRGQCWYCNIKLHLYTGTVLVLQHQATPLQGDSVRTATSSYTFTRGQC